MVRYCNKSVVMVTDAFELYICLDIREIVNILEMPCENLTFYLRGKSLIQHFYAGQISSASNCTDYQSRRLGIRYRPSEQPPSKPKKSKGNLAPTQFVHTLNATACAIPRMIICLLENYQQEDGSIIIPQPLRPFMGGLELIAPKSR